MTKLAAAAAVCGVVGVSAATTSVEGPSRYRVSAGTNFDLGNSGASHYLFNWSDAGGTFVNVIDPTLIFTVGETYTFVRTSGAHPFIITQGLALTGGDGTYVRVTSSGAVMDAATLSPIADFTANPAPSGDVITWTPQPGDEGAYEYTCRVTGHRGMTGVFIVEGAPAPACEPDVTTTNTNPGDAGFGEADGTVDGADLSYFVEQWLGLNAAVADVTTTNTNPGDAGFGEADGTVDGADLSYFVEVWLTGCP